MRKTVKSIKNGFSENFRKKGSRIRVRYLTKNIYVFVQFKWFVLFTTEVDISLSFCYANEIRRNIFLYRINFKFGPGKGIGNNIILTCYVHYFGCVFVYE